MSPSVSIVVLNWNGLRDTLRCLDSLAAAQVSFGKIDIVVIDNGSKIDPTQPIQLRFPEVDVLRLPQNQGFSGGCNAGIQLALANGATFICLLNNDTVVETDFLTPMIESFSLDEKLGLVSPVIRQIGSPGTIEFAGGIVSYALGKFSARRSISPASAHLRLCDYASGCCMLINRKAINDVGLFDEEFFAYFEDTDFSIRARNQGFNVACRLDTSIYHKGSATTRTGLSEGTTSPLKHYLIARNRIRLLRKHAPLFSRLVFFAIFQPIIIAYYLFGFFIRRRPRKARAFLSGIRDGFGSLNAQPAVGKWL